MSKRSIIIILSLAVVLCLVGGVTLASDPIYINSSDGVYDGPLSELYAIGGGGVSLLGEGETWALTGSGLAKVGGASTDDPQAARYVTVGLKYYYSASRDSSVAEARLENEVGSGYAIGYYDDDYVFHELARTSLTRLTLRPTKGNCIGVYSSDNGELIYQSNPTGLENFLGIRPLSAYGDAVTWFSGYKYYGGFKYACLGGAGITVCNVVELEKYVMGVCGSEMTDSWPLETLKAQAVCARTYALKMMGSNVYSGRCGFDLTADTYCQAYSGCSRVGSNIEAAVVSTAGEYITYNGSMIDALYFSSDGGATESNINVNGNNGHPYLKGKIDPYEAMSNDINPYSKWTKDMTPKTLGSKVGLDSIASVTPTLSETGNVIQLDFVDIYGNKATIYRDACRTQLGMFSLRYTISRSAGGNFIFTGSGWGHSLGMSQYGAYSMAYYYGLNYLDILHFYYTDVEIQGGV